MTVATESEWSRPSPRLWRMRVAEVLLVAVLALVITVAVVPVHRLVVLAIGAGVLLVVCPVAVLVMRRRVRGWGYLERDDDLLVRRGVLVQRLSVVPYGRMQLVEVTSGVMERMFSLATVKLHTAAARSDARIPGLDPAEAARLRDRLASLGEARAAGL